MSQKPPIEVFPPGEHIREELEARGWSQEVLAEIIGKSPRLVSEIITGKRAITPETAQALGDAFGTGAQVWMNLESMYRLAQVRNRDDAITRRSRIYSKAPIKEMVRRRWIAPSDDVEVLEERVLKFLRIQSLDDTPGLSSFAARKSTSYDQLTSSQVAWLVRSRDLAGAASAGQFRESRLKDCFDSIRMSLRDSSGVREVPKILAETGIRFAVLEHLPQTRIDGVAFWLDASTPAIVLSLRYDRIDCFWYTLLHELAHINNKDGRQGADALLDVDLVGEHAIAKQNLIERRADREAARFLVDQTQLNSFISHTRPLYSKQRIAEFAARLGVHPGLVVGQLQHRGEISFSHSREMLEKVRESITAVALTDGWGHYQELPSSEN